MKPNPICPTDAEDCTTRGTCAERCRKQTGATLLDLTLEGVRPATHFVGFRDPQQWENAVRVFGEPDVIHYVWDQRAAREIAPAIDRVVFARYQDAEPSPYSYDDSNEPDVPAARER